MPNGKCPKCGGEKEAHRGYCRACESTRVKRYHDAHPFKSKTEEQKEHVRELERMTRANESPEKRRARLDAERAWRQANPVSETKMQERREKAAIARSKWTPERHAQQKEAKDAHYARMQLRPALGLCGHSVHCTEPPIGKQRFCLTHWCKSLRLAELRIKPDYTVLELVDLWKSQAEKCAITGLPMIPGDTASLDHIIPISRGGDSTIRNLRFIHWSINRFKWDLTDAEFKRLITESCPSLLEWARNH